MNREESLDISARIGRIIAEKTPRIYYRMDDIAEEMASFSEEELLEMEEIGIYDGDFEKFYVIREFCGDIGLPQVADGDYIANLFRKAKKLDHKAFRQNPYLAVMKGLPAHCGDFSLLPSGYAKGEIFCYDMPDFSEECVVPKLGFFNHPVSFPTLYENGRPWMSFCPSELSSMEEPIKAAHGKVLVLGLGLGYYAYCVAQNPQVESVTVVELKKEVVTLFRDNLLPHLDFGGKLQLVCDDAFSYLARLKGGEFDFCFADIWEGAIDGAECYLRLQSHAERLPATEFAYWIEDSIRAYLGWEENE